MLLCSYGGVSGSHPLKAVGYAFTVTDLHDLPDSRPCGDVLPEVLGEELGTLFGKSAGVGTSVSEMHKDLHGTGMAVCMAKGSSSLPLSIAGFRHAGLELVEVTGLKPNTNYCFATMCPSFFHSAAFP